MSDFKTKATSPDPSVLSNLVTAEGTGLTVSNSSGDFTKTNETTVRTHTVVVGMYENIQVLLRGLNGG